MIGTVYRVLASLGQAALSVAVPIRQSVRPEYVVCLECGFRTNPAPASTGGARLIIAEYRVRWDLRSDHPVIALAYSQRRAAMAKEGLGRRCRSVELAAPGRRGSRRRPTTE